MSEAGVSAPALPARRPVPEQRRYPANFRGWLQTSARHFFILGPKATLADVSEWQAGTTSEAALRNTAGALMLVTLTASGVPRVTPESKTSTPAAASKERHTLGPVL